MTKRDAQLASARAAKAEYDGILAANRQIITATGELLSTIFKAEEDGHGKPTDGYWRRPPIGVRLEIGDRYLTATPGYNAHHNKRQADGSYSAVPGELHLEKVNIEVLIKANTLRGKRLMLSAKINEDGATLHRWRLDADATKMYVTFMLDTFKGLLADPYNVFAENSDHCSCCGKTLTDAVSMTRGIGPECIKYFGHLEEAISLLREKYRDLDAEWAF
jgi:hypothetical protein